MRLHFKFHQLLRNLAVRQFVGFESEVLIRTQISRVWLGILFANSAIGPIARVTSDSSLVVPLGHLLEWSIAVDFIWEGDFDGFDLKLRFWLCRGSSTRKKSRFQPIVACSRSSKAMEIAKSVLIIANLLIPTGTFLCSDDSQPQNQRILQTLQSTGNLLQENLLEIDFTWNSWSIRAEEFHCTESLQQFCLDQTSLAKQSISNQLSMD